MSIQTEIDRLASAKAGIASAIELKGVDVPDAALLQDFPALINDIPIGMVEWRLDFNGTSFIYEGAAQTFAQIYAAIEDGGKIVYAVYMNRLYIPQYANSTLVSFSCSYLDGTTPTIRRIRMTSDGTTNTDTQTFYNKTEIDAKETELKETKANKASYTTMTMLASGWVNNQYSFEVAYPHASYDIAIEVANTASDEQFDAFCEAKICGSANSNVVTALGDIPTVDIPVLVKVVAK